MGIKENRNSAYKQVIKKHYQPGKHEQQGMENNGLK
jgi:hypothetical protein